MVERTLAIIKPDAVKKKIIGKIIQRIEEEGFKILGLKMLHHSPRKKPRAFILCIKTNTSTKA